MKHFLTPLPLNADVFQGSSLSTFGTRSSIRINKVAKMLGCLGCVDLLVEHGNVGPLYPG